MHKRLCALVLLLGATAMWGQEVPPSPKAPSRALLPLSGLAPKLAPLGLPSAGRGKGKMDEADEEDAPPPSTLNDLQLRLLKLKQEREALDQERAKVSKYLHEPLTPESEATAKLRLRLGGLLTQMGVQKAAPRIQPPSHPAPEVPRSQPQTKKLGVEEVPATLPSIKVTPPAAPPAASAVTPVLDPLALAQALFRAGNHEGALQAYRMISLEGLKAEERCPVQYMIATCLQKVGKNEEASTLYREVANSKGDEQLATCARWQLASMRWHKEMKSQLDDIRQRRKNLEAKRD